MKISVVVDKSGAILGALIPPVTTNQVHPVNSLRLRASESQSIHETDLPQELFEHLGKESLVPELLKYRVQKTGRKVTLTRA
jgi:hypothetical protein